MVGDLLCQRLKTRGLDLLQRVRAEFSIRMIYISHSPGEITAICDQMIFLENGKLVKLGDPRELFTTRNAAVFDLK